jgi:preprotein translocase subunit SecG
MLINVLLVIFIAAAIAMVVLILLQQGKGADAGAAFGGGGGSQSVFGSRGSANFLSRVTAILAAIFFICSLSLGWMHMQRRAPSSVTELVSGAGTATDSASSQTQDSEIPEVPLDSVTPDGDGVPKVPE